MIFFFVLGFLDSLRKGWKRDLKDNEKRLNEYYKDEAETLMEIGVSYLEKGAIEKARDNFLEALENYGKFGDIEGEGYAHELIGDCYLSERNFEAAFDEYEYALKCYNDAKSSLQDELVDKMREVKMLKEAIQESSEIRDIEVREELSSVSREDTIKKIDSLIIEFIGLMDKYNSYKGLVNDISYLEDALESSKLIEDWEGQGTLHLIMGEIFFRRGEYTQCLEHFNEAYNIFKGKDKKGEGISLLLVGVTSFVIGETEIYEILNRAMKILCEVSDEACDRAYGIIEVLKTL